MINGPEKRMLAGFIAARRLKASRRREDILDAFLATERHVTADELHAAIRSRHPGIGLATVYRTLKLLASCGLARQVTLGGGPARFEHAFRHRHHDHLICRVCGRVVEFSDPEIELRQEAAAAARGFSMEEHSLEIRGVCGACRAKAGRSRSGG
ncbi:MAG: transcriptional repressor [Elusimicrobiota bacterium]